MRLDSHEQYYFGDASAQSHFRLKVSAEELERHNKDLEDDVLNNMWLFLAKDDTEPLLELRQSITSAARSPIPLLDPEVVHQMFGLDGQLKRTIHTLQVYKSFRISAEEKERAFRDKYLVLVPMVLRLKEWLEDRADDRATTADLTEDLRESTEDLNSLMESWMKEVFGPDVDRREILREKEEELEKEAEQIEEKLRELQESDSDPETKRQQQEKLKNDQKVNEADKQRIKDLKEQIDGVDPLSRIDQS